MTKFKIDPLTLANKIKRFEGVTDLEPAVDVLVTAAPPNEDFDNVRAKYQEI